MISTKYSKTHFLILYQHSDVDAMIQTLCPACSIYVYDVIATEAEKFSKLIMAFTNSKHHKNILQIPI